MKSLNVYPSIRTKKYRPGQVSSVPGVFRLNGNLWLHQILANRRKDVKQGGVFLQCGNAMFRVSGDIDRISGFDRVFPAINVLPYYGG
ncbi:hypothetical protein BK140_22965 [Paenibacillus macerans]|nr:hypothetical protein BK140_22965 [Paenibacillus macerans]